MVQLIWSADRVAHLLVLRRRRLSAGEIASEIGGVTRNAVIGKIHRLGLSIGSGIKDDPECEEQRVPLPEDVREAVARRLAEEAPPVDSHPDAAGAGDAKADAPDEAMRMDDTTPSEKQCRGDQCGEEADADDILSSPEAEASPPAEDDLPLSPFTVGESRQAIAATLARINEKARKLSLLELTERTCKWPIGDPDKPGYHYCGLPAKLGKPYCSEHAAIAYQPAALRRSRDRNRSARKFLPRPTSA